MRKDMWAWKGPALIGIIAPFSQASNPLQVSLTFLVIAAVVYVWEYYLVK